MTIFKRNRFFFKCMIIYQLIHLWHKKQHKNFGWLGLEPGTTDPIKNVKKIDFIAIYDFDLNL